MIRAVPAVACFGSTILISSTAMAYVNTIFAAPNDPSSYGTLIASLDTASTAWDWPADNSAGKLDSGYKAEILDGAGNPISPDFGVSPNTSSLRTDVYRVNTATTVGSLNLIPGDLAFAYRIGLTANNANTIETLQKFGVGGLDPNLFPQGDGTFTEDILVGRAYTLDGLASPTTQFPIAGPGDLEVLPGLLSQVDYEWAFGDQSSQMANAEEITLLLFARSAIVINGFANFAGVSGQAGPTTDQNANDAPVLIPGIPAPGTVVLASVAGMMATRRRRK